MFAETSRIVWIKQTKLTTWWVQGLKQTESVVLMLYFSFFQFITIQMARLKLSFQSTGFRPAKLTTKHISNSPPLLQNPVSDFTNPIPFPNVQTAFIS